MALKIEHIDVNEVKGTLDGALPFEVKRINGSMVAKIQDWTREFADQSAHTVSEMRRLAYEGLASYRMHQRGIGA